MPPLDKNILDAIEKRVRESNKKTGKRTQEEVDRDYLYGVLVEVIHGNMLEYLKTELAQVRSDFGSVENNKE